MGTIGAPSNGNISKDHFERKYWTGKTKNEFDQFFKDLNKNTHP